MNRSHTINLSVITALGLALLVGSALADQNSVKEKIVGTWAYVSAINTRPDGSKFEPNGGNASKGVLIFDSLGNFSGDVPPIVETGGGVKHVTQPG